MLAQLRQFWSKLSPVMQAVYAGTAVALLAVISAVGFWSSQTQYAVLASNLDSDGASKIIQKLDADKISYKLSNDGSTILVPAEKASLTRLRLSTPEEKGFEHFDQMSIGTPPFIQTTNYNRALQSELARTIMQLEPVANAKVMVVMPDPTPFVREEKPVTASVMIKTKPGASLSRAATTGIVAFVAGSVKGLIAENVTVIDSDGRVLSEKKDPRGGAVSNDQLAYQREVESHLAQNAQEILTRLIGPGRAVVRVTAEMSFRHLKEMSEKYDPEGTVVVRESSMTSKISAPTGPKGPTGAVSNIPPSPTPGVSGPNAIPDKNDKTMESEYAVSRVNRSQEEQQGVIDRLTVAVMLIPPRGGETPEEALGITPEEVNALVRQAVGFKDGRDQIQVSIGKVQGEQAAEAIGVEDHVVAAVPFGHDFVSIVRGASLGVAGLIALAIAARAMRRRPHKAPDPDAFPAYAGMKPLGKDEMEELSDLHAVAATIRAWLEEPAVIRFEGKAPEATAHAKPA